MGALLVSILWVVGIVGVVWATWMLSDMMSWGKDKRKK